MTGYYFILFVYTYDVLTPRTYYFDLLNYTMEFYLEDMLNRILLKLYYFIISL